jgi:hypothetical protein
MKMKMVNLRNGDHFILVIVPPPPLIFRYEESTLKDNVRCKISLYIRSENFNEHPLIIPWNDIVDVLTPPWLKFKELLGHSYESN